MFEKDKTKDNLIEDLTNKTRELKKDIYIHERIQEKLINSKKGWEQTFDAIPDIIAVIDKEYKIVRANKTMAEKLGVKREALIGELCCKAMHGSEEPPAYCPHKKTLSSGKEQFEALYEQKLKGCYIFSSTPMYDEKGQLAGIVEVARDITERKLAEEALKESEAKAKAISDSSIDAIIVIDGRGVISYFNQAAERMFGYRQEEVAGRELHSFLVSEKARKEYYHTLPVFEITGQCRVVGKTLELSAIKKDGTRLPVELSISAFQINGQWHSAGTVRDITDRKNMEEKLLAASITDDLTGLLNRRGFFSFAEKQLELARRNRRALLLFFLDIDDMKKINDTLGHKAGDQALVDTADVLRKTFRTSDIIARMGGDEFIVLVIEPRCPDIENIINDKMMNRLKIHNAQTERGCKLSVSVGFAHFEPDKPLTLDELISIADVKMYEDKQRRKS